MRFPAELKKVGGSLMVTVPKEIVKKFNLKEKQIKEFELIRNGEK